MSLSTLQTARSLKQGEWSSATSVGYQSIVLDDPKKTGDSESDELSQEIADDIEAIKLPVVEQFFQYAPVPKLDLGLKLVLPGGYGIEAKYNLINQASFALAVGGGYSNLTIASQSSSSNSDSENSTSSESELSITDFVVPVIASYDLTAGTTVYAAPKVILRTTSSSYQDNNGASVNASVSSTLVGLSAGLTLNWFILEGTYLTNPDESAAGFTQFLVGFWSGWNDLDKG